MHGWLERVRPEVHVLTDGSGSRGLSRLPGTAEILNATGASAGSIFGRLTDREAYRMLIEGDVEGGAALARELSEAIAKLDATWVAGDAMEGFNPVHDLARVILDAAVADQRRRGRPLPAYDFPLEGPPGLGDEAPGALRFVLDEEALERKIAAAAAYDELRSEVERALAAYGKAAFRSETLCPVHEDVPLSARVPQPPAYERFGAERVEAGLYRQVLCFDEHFAPWVEALHSRLGLG